LRRSEPRSPVGARVRSEFTAGLEPILELLSNVVPGQSKAERRRKAIATMAEMIGALILARAVDDPALSGYIAEFVGTVASTQWC
jgi:TetR/AcrR family transcriptional regulator, transcriptional repressor for nem operon